MANALQNLASRAAAFVKDESGQRSEPELGPARTNSDLSESASHAMCSKCGARRRTSTSETNPWCKECIAEYNREYENRKLARKESRGFALGVATMRTELAKRFGDLGFSSLEAWEVRDAILQFPSPSLPDND